MHQKYHCVSSTVEDVAMNRSVFQSLNERRRIEAITASTETVDMTDRFLPCAVSGLAYYLALRRPQIEIQRRQELKMLYEEELKRAMEDNREKVDMIIKPDLRYNI